MQIRRLSGRTFGDNPKTEVESCASMPSTGAYRTTRDTGKPYPYEIPYEKGTGFAVKGNEKSGTKKSGCAWGDPAQSKEEGKAAMGSTSEILFSWTGHKYSV